MDTSTSNTAYYPLYQNEIRLLKLAPGQWDDEIHCKLTHALLPNKPDFIALSYAWGSSKVVRSIKLDGQVRRVTASAHDALRQLRQTYGKTTVWVDAICINQSDHDERNHQVAIMGGIFTCASMVVVYLGEVRSSNVLTSSSRRVTSPRSIFFTDGMENDKLEAFLKHCRSTRASMHSGLDEALEVFCLLHGISEDQDLGSAAPFDPASQRATDSKYQRSLFEALRLMVCSRWWDRMWTLQEVVLPRNLTILYGPCVSDWGLLVRAAINYSKNKNSPTLRSVPLEFTKVLDLYAQKVIDVNEMRTRWAAQEQSTLLPLLRRFSGRHASDTRDRVYALLGLVRGPLPIQPDYALDVAYVFIETALGIMRTTNSLDVLNGDIGRKFRQDLPSWVPDWSADFNELDRRRAETVQLYHTSLQSSIHVEPPIRFDGENSSIRDYLNRLLSKRGEGPLRRNWRANNCTDALGTSHWTSFVGCDLQADDPELLEEDCFVAVKNYLTAQCGPSFSRQYRDHIDLPGLKIGKILALGEVILSDQDITPVIQSWGSMAKEYSEDWTSFITTLYADIVWVKSAEGLTCRRANSGDKKALISWLFYQPDAPFGVRWIQGRPRVSSIRDALLQLASAFEGSAQSGDILDLEYSIRLATSRRRFFVTQNKEFGLCPAQASVGDHIYALPGGRAPFILRDAPPPQALSPTGLDGQFPRSDPRKYLQVIGDSFVHGAMNGAAMSAWSEESPTGLKVPAGMITAVRMWKRALYQRNLLQVGNLELTEAMRILKEENPGTFKTFSEKIRSLREHKKEHGEEKHWMKGCRGAVARPKVTCGEQDWMIQNHELHHDWSVPSSTPASRPTQETEERVRNLAAKKDRVKQLLVQAKQEESDAGNLVKALEAEYTANGPVITLV